MKPVVTGILLAIVCAVGALTFIFLDDHRRNDQAAAAIEAKYGPTDKGIGLTERSYCPSGFASRKFRAAGPQSQGERRGYVCTSWWRKATVHEAELEGFDGYVEWIRCEQPPGYCPDRR